MGGARARRAGGGCRCGHAPSGPLGPPRHCSSCRRALARPAGPSCCRGRHASRPQRPRRRPLLVPPQVGAAAGGGAAVGAGPRLRHQILRWGCRSSSVCCLCCAVCAAVALRLEALLLAFLGEARARTQARSLGAGQAAPLRACGGCMPPGSPAAPAAAAEPPPAAAPPGAVRDSRRAHLPGGSIKLQRGQLDVHAKEEAIEVGCGCCKYGNMMAAPWQEAAPCLRGPRPAVAARCLRRAHAAAVCCSRRTHLAAAHPAPPNSGGGPVPAGAAHRAHAQQAAQVGALPPHPGERQQRASAAPAAAALVCCAGVGAGGRLVRCAGGGGGVGGRREERVHCMASAGGRGCAGDRGAEGPSCSLVSAPSPCPAALQLHALSAAAPWYCCVACCRGTAGLPPCRLEGGRPPLMRCGAFLLSPCCSLVSCSPPHFARIVPACVAAVL